MTVVVGAMLPRHDWSNGLHEVFWSGVRNRSDQPTATEREPPRARKRPPDKRTETIVRTLCVRLCDGYYWPISFATGKSRLPLDAKRCESSCSSPARLFFHGNPGQTADDMVDRDGNPYRQLPTAFLYRTRYLADCTCRPQPWEEEAAARHRAFADAAGSTTTRSGRPGHSN